MAVATEARVLWFDGGVIMLGDCLEGFASLEEHLEVDLLAETPLRPNGRIVGKMRWLERMIKQVLELRPSQTEGWRRLKKQKKYVSRWLASSR